MIKYIEKLPIFHLSLIRYQYIEKTDIWSADTMPIHRYIDHIFDISTQLYSVLAEVTDKHVNIKLSVKNRKYTKECSSAQIIRNLTDELFWRNSFHFLKKSVLKLQQSTATSTADVRAYGSK